MKNIHKKIEKELFMLLDNFIMPTNVAVEITTYRLIQKKLWDAISDQHNSIHTFQRNLKRPS